MPKRTTKATTFKHNKPYPSPRKRSRWQAMETIPVAIVSAKYAGCREAIACLIRGIGRHGSLFGGSITLTSTSNRPSSGKFRGLVLDGGEDGQRARTQLVGRPERVVRQRSSSGRTCRTSNASASLPSQGGRTKPTSTPWSALNRINKRIAGDRLAPVVDVDLFAPQEPAETAGEFDLPFRVASSRRRTD